MCGIVGYVGSKNATPYLIEGLSKLEYRGYDSAGIAVVNNGSVTVIEVIFALILSLLSLSIQEDLLL